MSATKFHLTPKGQARQCSAKTPESCKYSREAGEVVAHYDTKEEAQSAYEKQASASIGAIKPLSKGVFPKNKNNLGEVRTAENVETWQNIAIIGKNIDKLTATANRENWKKNDLDKARTAMDRAYKIKNLNDIEFNKTYSGTRESQIQRFAGEAKKAFDMAQQGSGNSFSLSPYYYYYGDVDELNEEIHEAQELNKASLDIAEGSLNDMKGAHTRLKATMKKYTGYEEDPLHGVPTDETTLDKWKGKKVGSYSSGPTKDVPILENGKLFVPNVAKRGTTLDTRMVKSNVLMVLSMV